MKNLNKLLLLITTVWTTVNTDQACRDWNKLILVVSVDSQKIGKDTSVVIGI
jgi:hypothetical protein